jgi:hypothetical protein
MTTIPNLQMNAMKKRIPICQSGGIPAYMAQHPDCSKVDHGNKHNCQPMVKCTTESKPYTLPQDGQLINIDWYWSLQVAYADFRKRCHVKLASGGPP